MMALLLLPLLLLTAAAPRITAFAPSSVSSLYHVRSLPSPPSIAVLSSPKSTALLASDDVNNNSSMDDNNNINDNNDEDNEDEEEENEVVKVDPKIAAWKEEIGALEKTLQSKNRELYAIQDMVEEYSKSGYSRKVAEMSMIRQSRSAAFVSNKDTARAAVLTQFLPILEELDRIDELYASSEFAKNYGALKGNTVAALRDLGAVEFTVRVGNPIDRTRMNVVEEVEGDDDGGIVLRPPVRVGLELMGNVLRKADVIVSKKKRTSTDEEEPTTEVAAVEEENNKTND